MGETHTTGSPPEPPELPVGITLARFRRAAGITGQELGRRVGMSQAKISKIETGAISPSPADVARLASKLGVAQAEIDRLIEHAEQTRDHMTDFRVGRDDPAVWQREIGQLEADARVFRGFHPAVISGLLQTSEYARSVLTTVRESRVGAGYVAQVPVSEALSARVHRQEVLDDPGKEFHFVLPETVLRNVVSSIEEMPAQLLRLRDVSRQQNVTLKVITEETFWPSPPYNGFSLLDDQYVIIDLYNTVVVSRGQSDLRLYRQTFDALEAKATDDIEPILEKYRRMYLRRAQGE
jgi:transcriptional regulator with XRE-family HTH domain